MTKCTEATCNKKATHYGVRGTERIPYCENHAKWFNELMSHCF